MSRIVLALQVLAIAAAAFAQSPAQIGVKTRSSTLVIGFVGGFVHADDARHSEIQLAEKLRASYGNGVTIRIFENRRKEQAHKLILDWRGNTGPSAQPQQGPSLILYGHSWGASAVVSLARELAKDRVPVALTIQVDSIEKHGEDDSLIPANVAEAINFYQPRGFLHGRQLISAADPSHTHILGNFLFTYAHKPAECRTYPWYNRMLFPGHTSIECDPQVWSQIETLIRTHLPSTSPPSGTDTAIGSVADFSSRISQQAPR